MKLYINVKQAGSRKNYITKEEISLKAVPKTLRELIGEIVAYNVKKFNEKANGQKVIDYLTTEEIKDRLQVGKVSFGELNNTAKVSLSKALECAYLAYEDGIYRVFIGDAEVEGLDEPLKVTEGDVLTFIRLTMLAGRMW